MTFHIHACNSERTNIEKYKVSYKDLQKENTPVVKNCMVIILKDNYIVTI